MTEWFEEWFGEEYLQLYPHRDAAEADRAVGLILDRVGFAPGWRVLDVACGAGRHARAFQAAGGRRFTERVRLFGPDEIARMLADAGVAVRHRFGDYDASPLGPDSPRTILLGQAA